MTLKLFGNKWLHVSSSIYFFFFYTTRKKTFFFPFFTVYPCRVCEQTNGKKTKTKKKINKENMYKKKNEQNGTNTRIHSMRHKIERE